MELGVINRVENLFGVFGGTRKRFHGNTIVNVLIKGASASFIVMVLGAVLAFGTNMLLARLMGVTQYGIYI